MLHARCLRRRLERALEQQEQSDDEEKKEKLPSQRLACVGTTSGSSVTISRSVDTSGMTAQEIVARAELEKEKGNEVQCKSVFEVR